MTYEIPISKTYAKIALITFGWFSLIMVCGVVTPSNIGLFAFFLCCGIFIGIGAPIIQLVTWWVNDNVPFHFREDKD